MFDLAIFVISTRPGTLRLPSFLRRSQKGKRTQRIVHYNRDVTSLSASFHWNAQEVSKLGKSCFYILARKKLSVENVKVRIGAKLP